MNYEDDWIKWKIVANVEECKMKMTKIFEIPCWSS